MGCKERARNWNPSPSPNCSAYIVNSHRLYCPPSGSSIVQANRTFVSLTCSIHSIPNASNRKPKRTLMNKRIIKVSRPSCSLWQRTSFRCVITLLASRLLERCFFGLCTRKEGCEWMRLFVGSYRIEGRSLTTTMMLAIFPYRLVMLGGGVKDTSWWFYIGFFPSREDTNPLNWLTRYLNNKTNFFEWLLTL